MDRERWYYQGVQWCWDLDIKGIARSEHKIPHYVWELKIKPGQVGVIYMIPTSEFRKRML